MFKQLCDKGIKELTDDEIKAEICSYFGMTHTTIINYKNSFFSMGFFEFARNENQIQYFKINYDKVIKYCEKVKEIEQPTA